MVLEPKKLLKSVVGMVCFLAASLGYGAEPYKPTVESLQQYQCPEWFRDAKFGIYLHWGAYSVVERGEWYARKLYEEGGEDYAYHLEHYGHPSEFGYKDFIPLWKAENFDPDACWPFSNVPVRYISHHVRFIMTTLICGIQNITNGMLLRWGRSETLSVPGGMPHSRRACGLV